MPTPFDTIDADVKIESGYFSTLSTHYTNFVERSIIHHHRVHSL